MGHIRRARLLKSNLGQSTVEYVLLMAVVISLMTTIWNSRAFNDFLGDDSDFFNGIAEMIRVHYQFAATAPMGTEFPESPVLAHPSFVNGGVSRFFTYGSQGNSYPFGGP